MSQQTETSPTGTMPTPGLSIAPVVLPAPDRAADLQMRISAPRTGHDLPLFCFRTDTAAPTIFRR